VAKFPLVLVPALGSDERLWAPVVERIQDDVDCVVIRGEGDSIESMADHVLSCAPEDFYLAGISMGSYVCLEVALRQTDRVRAVAFLNGSAIAAPADRRESSLRLIEMADSGQFQQAVDLISAAVAPRRPDVTAIAASMARDLGPEVFEHQQLAVLNRRDRSADLPKLDVPTLVVVGETDTVTPCELGEELAAAVPGAQLAVLAGVGHLSTLEDPDGVSEVLTQWLARADEALATDWSRW